MACCLDRREQKTDAVLKRMCFRHFKGSHNRPHWPIFALLERSQNVKFLTSSYDAVRESTLTSFDDD